MRIFALLGTMLGVLFLFTCHMLLITKDSLESDSSSSLSMLAPMSSMPHLFTLEEQTWIAEHPVIHVSLSSAFVPTESSAIINKYSAISLDFLRRLSLIIGIQFKVEPQSNWTNIIEDARQCRIDLLAMAEPSMADETHMRFTKPYIPLQGLIVTQKDILMPASLSELEGKRATVRYRQFWHGYIEEHYPRIKLDFVGNTLQGLLYVFSGKSHAFVGYDYNIFPHLAVHNSLNLRATAAISSQSGLAFGVRSDWPMLHTILSKALQAIPTAERQSIYARWQEKKQLFSLPQRALWIALLAVEVVAGILLLSLFWNMQLRRRVEERTQRLTAELKKSAKAEDLERLNDELRQAMCIADAATEAKSRFLANISHEIRTPLHGIISFTELAYLKGQPLPRKHQRTILELSYTLLDIVNDTLDFSKIEAGKMAMDRAPFMLDDVVLRVCDMTMRGTLARHLECIVDIDPATPLAVVGDAGHLQQILTNLIGNAIKFTPDGGRVHLQVQQNGLLHTNGDQHNANFLFLIHDTGVGIASEQLPYLFQPFKQADSSLTRRHGGTGLGLSIARRMVESLGGEIWVESEQGQGSTFAFSINLGLQEQVEVLSGTTFTGLQGFIVGGSSLSTRIITRTLEALGMDVIAYQPPATTPALPFWEGSTPETILVERLNDTPCCCIPDIKLPPQCTPDFLLIDRLHGDEGCPPAVMLATHIEQQLEHPVPVLLVGGPHESMSIDGLHQQQGMEVIPAVTVRSVRAALRRLLESSEYAGQPRPVLPRPRQHYAPPDLSSVRLLIVEDNLVNQEIMRALLEETQAYLRMTRTGKEALAALQEEHFDLIFLDIQMPDMDGYETITIIREQGLILPVVALTAHAMQSDKQRCLDAGMDAYLSKPFKQSLLFDTLHLLLPDKYRETPLPKPVLSFSDVLNQNRIPQTPEAPSKPVKPVDNASQWASLPSCFDAAIIQQTGLSPKQYDHILLSFSRNHGQDSALFRHCLRQRDWTALRDKAHALKGAAANLGAHRLKEVASALEREAQHALAAPSGKEFPDASSDTPCPNTATVQTVQPVQTGQTGQQVQTDRHVHVSNAHASHTSYGTREPHAANTLEQSPSVGSCPAFLSATILPDTAHGKHAALPARRTANTPLKPRLSSTLVTLLTTLEHALSEVLKAIAERCPTAQNPNPPPQRKPAPILGEPVSSELDAEGTALQYQTLKAALRQSSPEAVRTALASLLVTCTTAEYPLLQRLKTHIDDYEYDAALTLLETAWHPEQAPSPSTLDAAEPSQHPATEASHVA